MGELLSAFDRQNMTGDVIEITMVLPNGQVEAAEDNGGVLRDCLVECWTDFYENCTMGNNFKVPCLRHDFDESKWRAAANVFMVG
jgi:hypothetical protein